MIKYTQNGVLLSGKDAFSPAQTFDCGQAFRFLPFEGGYCGVAGGRYLEVSERDGETLLSCSREDFEGFWKDYFDLGRDYLAIEIDPLDSFLTAAREYGRGIRILRQPPFEALCSFIISQCNNIPRIRGIISRLCELGGERLENGLYTFPTPERVEELGLEGLAALRAGYRAPYLLGAARAVNEGRLDLESLKTLPTDEARAELLKLEGVGRKVADCVLLYGLGHTDAFPVDVWIKRALATVYPEGFDYLRYGENAGVIQQYIFFYAREYGLEKK